MSSGLLDLRNITDFTSTAELSRKGLNVHETRHLLDFPYAVILLPTRSGSLSSSFGWAIVK